MNPGAVGSQAGFVSEVLRPVPGTADAGAMASGGPGLPQAFTWRKQVLRVAAVRRTWRETGPCHHGSGEQYARKHWFEVETDAGEVATLYFERQPRGGGKTRRWWLYSLDRKSGRP